MTTSSWVISKFGAHHMKTRITLPFPGNFKSADEIREEIARQVEAIRVSRASAKQRALNSRRDVLDLASLQFIETEKCGCCGLRLRRTRH